MNKYTVLYTRLQCVREGGYREPQTEKTPAAKSLFAGKFFQITTFDIAFYQSILSTSLSITVIVDVIFFSLYFKICQII